MNTYQKGLYKTKPDVYNTVLRKELLLHPLLLQMRKKFSHKQMSLVLGQWYYPLNFFPTFLASLIASVPQMELKSYLATILWQELGSGNARQSHLALFVETMKNMGFTVSELIDAPPLQTTSNLLNAYKNVTQEDYLYGIGFIYATEAIDLGMVSAVGAALRNLNNKKKLPWVDIHIEQEPDHTNCVDEVVNSESMADMKDQILKHAEYTWNLWIEFYNGIQREIL